MRRLTLVTIAALALAAVLGFTAEPTTSTQLDVVGGRGVAVVQAAGNLLPGPDVTGERPEPHPLVPALLVLLIVGLRAVVLARRTREAGGHLSSVLGRAALAHRGPPLLA